jgi:hypothetical protein
MALRGKKPEVTESRLKLFLFGEAGAGKTTAAIQMPCPYVIDTEKGTAQKSSVEQIQKAGGAVFAATSATELLDEIKSLAIEKHPYKTLVIDPITNIEDNVINDAQSKYDKQKKDGGDMRVWRDRDQIMRRIRSMLLSIDMNVVITAHGKTEYAPGGAFQKIGTTFEGWKKWPYLFDLVIELSNQGKKRMAVVKKSRMATEFPDGDQFEWSYQELAKRYNPAIMEKEAVAVVLASPEQVSMMKKIMETMKVSDEWMLAVFNKAGVECWEDMPSDKIQKCIDSKLSDMKELRPEKELAHAV